MSLILGRDSVGAVTYSLPIEGIHYSVVLTANTAQNITIPNDNKFKYVAFFSWSTGTDIWVNFKDGAIATLPSGILVQSENIQNPIARHYVYGGKTISLISGTNTAVNISLYVY